LAIARVLDAIESEASLASAVVSGTRSTTGTSARAAITTPPWALWNDPHAQAAYVEAERIADEMPSGLRGGAVAAHLADRADAIDEQGV
jgi:hypothetical protein